MPEPSHSSSGKLILLIGPPNVGKSVIFSEMSGMDVAMANYPGTTVDYTEGEVLFGPHRALVIDVPGTYTLEASNEAEEVAIQMLDREPDLVVCVLDAANLESSIYLALQVLERRLPTLIAVNRIDLLRERGLQLDTDALSRALGTDVLRTAAVAGEGLDTLHSTICSALDGPERSTPSSKTDVSWTEAEGIHRCVITRLRQSGVTRRDLIGDASMRPWPGVLVACGVLVAVFATVVGLGMALRRFVLLPVFTGLIIPQIVSLIQEIVPSGLLQNIMIGEYGFLTKGVEWPFTLVMPYVLSFYLALCFLEDSGYLPRLGVMLDGLLGKIGLSGAGIIPLLLGYGCGIPAIMSTRALSSHKHRLTVSLMVSLSIPCMAQTGAFISLLAARSIGALSFVAAISISALAITGLLLGRILPGQSSPTLMEIPDLLLPRPVVLGKKLWVRTKHYIKDAVPAVVGGVAVAAVLYETGLMIYLGALLRPVVAGWLQLPEEAAVPILLGIFRRELTVLPLLDMNLTTLQLTVGSVVALFYVPCVAMVAVLMREFGARFALATLVITTIFAFLVGGIVARAGLLLLTI